MFGKFTETIGDKLAELWTTRALTPAFVFWLLGAFLGYRKLGGDGALATTFMHWPVLIQVAALVSAVVVVVASGQLVRSLARPFIRLLEGYELHGLGRLFALVRILNVKCWNRMLRRFKELADRYERAPATERQEYARLHLELSTRGLPTRTTSCRPASATCSAQPRHAPPIDTASI